MKLDRLLSILRYSNIIICLPICVLCCIEKHEEMTSNDLQMTFSDLQMTLRPKTMVPSSPPWKMLQKWSNIRDCNCNCCDNILVLYLQPGDQCNIMCVIYEKTWYFHFQFYKYPGGKSFQFFCGKPQKVWKITCNSCYLVEMSEKSYTPWFLHPFISYF